MQYLRLARMSDHLLAEGPFSSSTDILAAPETIAVGDALTPEGLAGKLERAGYTGAPLSAEKSYAMQAHAVQILPGADSSRDRVRVEFAQGKIAAIVSLRDRIATKQYQLDPRLLTNLSANREKRRMVRFADIPQSLIDAVTSAEDKRFFHHWGFDYRRAFKAAYVDFKDGRKQQGASTLTMQLARAFFLDPGKSWRRKIGRDPDHDPPGTHTHQAADLRGLRQRDLLRAARHLQRQWIRRGCACVLRQGTAADRCT